MSEYRTHCGDAIPEALREAEARVDLPYTLGNLDRLLSSSRQGLERVREIVAGLRDFSRLDEADRKLIDPNDSIRSTLELVRYHIRQKGIDLVLDLGDVPHCWCFAGKLNQVLLNILMNAIQAVPDGATITVATGTNPERTEVEIAISDDGPGIPDEIRGKIFDPFFTTKPQGLGTGLGLWITYNVVQEHQGRIDLETEVGRGTTFRIVLPTRLPCDPA
jgi:two-component system, NtrC family, sensor kinase